MLKYILPIYHGLITFYMYTLEDFFLRMAYMYYIVQYKNHVLTK